MTMPPRARQLEAAFAMNAGTRMAGPPTMHPALRVEAVGFMPHAAPDGEAGLLGVLVTPWRMNLVWLPARPHGTDSVIRPGIVREHVVRGARYTFLGAHERLQALGAYAVSSLFSPMQDFADHAGARAVAEEVLRVLRTHDDTAPAAPARRAFLLPRRAA